MTISIKPVVEGEAAPKEVTPSDAMVDLGCGILVGLIVTSIEPNKVSVWYPMVELGIEYTGSAYEMQDLVGLATQVADKKVVRETYGTRGTSTISSDVALDHLEHYLAKRNSIVLVALQDLVVVQDVKDGVLVWQGSIQAMSRLFIAAL